MTTECVPRARTPSLLCCCNLCPVQVKGWSHARSGACRGNHGTSKPNFTSLAAGVRCLLYCLPEERPALPSADAAAAADSTAADWVATTAGVAARAAGSAGDGGGAQE